MNVLVVGAGAIGGLLAALLAEKGHTVEARGRDRRLTHMRVEGGGYGPDRDVALGELAGKPDLVLLGVKTQDIEKALREHAASFADAPVVALQNGLAQDELVRAAVGPQRAVAAIVALDAEYLGGDRVRCARKGTLLVGPAANDPAGAAAAARARELLRDAVSVEEARDVPGARWTKLLVNLQNVVPAITGLSYQETAKHPELARAVIRMLGEARQVADAEGVTLAPLPWTNPMLLRALSRLPEAVATPLYAKRVEKVLGKTPAYGSTWQSMQRGQSLETEWLNGEVVRRGKRHGVATPVNERAVALAAAGQRLSADEAARRLLAD